MERSTSIMFHCSLILFFLSHYAIGQAVEYEGIHQSLKSRKLLWTYDGAVSSPSEISSNGRKLVRECGFIQCFWIIGGSRFQRRHGLIGGGGRGGGGGGGIYLMAKSSDGEVPSPSPTMTSTRGRNPRLEPEGEQPSASPISTSRYGASLLWNPKFEAPSPTPN